MAALLLFVGCSGSGDAAADLGDEGESALGAGTVQSVSLQGCSTGVVRGLTDQLLTEIACLSPDALGDIQSIPNLELDVDVLPVVQKPLVQALTDAAAANNAPMKITSALRTLPQQYILHRWAGRKRCGVTLAAKVGESNHEQGLAVDISTNGGSTANKKIRASMKAHDFTWLGADDPVHFDYTGTSGVVDLAGLSTRAFQRLWNRNHPEAKLEENGVYDATVEKKLIAAPAVGFPIGARCD